MVVAIDSGLDLAVLKMAGQGYTRAVLGATGRSLGERDLCVIGGGVRHNSGKLFRQAEVELFSSFGPARTGAQPNTLVLNGPVNPGLSGSPVFDRHGDVVGLVNARLSGHPTRAAVALDIRAALGVLRNHKVPFATGGAPVEHSLGELYGLTQAAVVTLAGPGTPLAKGERLVLPDGPSVRMRKQIPFIANVAAFTPDGKKIAVVRHLGSGPSNRSEIVLVQEPDGTELMTLTGQSSHVGSLRFSPDGRYLLSIVPQIGFHLDKPAFLWNMENGTVWYHLPPAHDGEFSPDGELIALRVGGINKSWRLGPRLTEDVEVGIHRTDTGARVAQIIPGKNQLCGELYQCVFLPKSGRLLTVGFWYDFKHKQHEALHLWDASGALLADLTPQPALPYPKYGYVRGTAAISPDERTLVLEGYTEGMLAVVYEFPSMRARYSIPQGPNDGRQTMGAKFSPANDSFLMRGGGYMNKHVRIYDAASGAYFWRFDGDWTAEFAPDGTRLMQIGGSGFVIWELPQDRSPRPIVKQLDPNQLH